MRRTLSWIAKSAGYHVDASRHYQICQDEGTWVLTSNGSLVRHFSTLREAKRAAENQEATGDQGRVDWTAISEGQMVQGETGWVILYRPEHGVWREVAAPFDTRHQARQVLETATHLRQQASVTMIASLGSLMSKDGSA